MLVLDDEESTRASLAALLDEHGYDTRLHADPDSLFKAGTPAAPACLLLDNNLNHRKNGIDVHAEIVRRGWGLPVIFLTGEWNVQQVVNVVRSGADGFLTKPYDTAELLANVRKALDTSRSQRKQQRAAAEACLRAQALTPREREVVVHVLKGKPNKEVAADLGVALVTVKVHRGRAMKKLGADNIADLARIASAAGIVR